VRIRRAGPRGERRDYRAVLSFDREVESDQAMAMAKEWIEDTRFRDNPALYAFHTQYRQSAYPCAGHRA